MPRHQWELGVTEKLLIGTDHLCRTVALCTSKGHTTQSLVKLYPVDQNVDDCLEDSNKNIDLNLAPDEVKQKTHVPCTAAVATRDAIAVQLIGPSQD